MKLRTLAPLIGLLAVSAVIFTGSRTAAEERSFVVIINPDNPAESMTKDVASRLFLKMVSKWKEDAFLEQVRPVDQDPASPVREEFSKFVHGRSVASIKNYWQRQIFSGRGVPPDELASDEAVIDFVKANRGAIGYVSSRVRLEGVRELALIADREN